MSRIFAVFGAEIAVVVACLLGLGFAYSWM